MNVRKNICIVGAYVVALTVLGASTMAGEKAQSVLAPAVCSSKSAVTSNPESPLTDYTANDSRTRWAIRDNYRAHMRKDVYSQLGKKEPRWERLLGGLAWTLDRIPNHHQALFVYSQILDRYHKLPDPRNYIFLFRSESAFPPTPGAGAWAGTQRSFSSCIDLARVTLAICRPLRGATLACPLDWCRSHRLAP